VTLSSDTPARFWSAIQTRSSVAKQEALLWRKNDLLSLDWTKGFASWIRRIRECRCISWNELVTKLPAGIFKVHKVVWWTVNLAFSRKSFELPAVLYRMCVDDLFRTSLD
jgi:hypothetical protein